MPVRWFIQTLVLLCVYVNATEAPEQHDAKTSPSATLLTEYSKILSNFIKESKAKGSIPAEVKDEKLIANGIKAARDGGMFDTTPDQEFAFAKGSWSDNAALASVLKSAKMFEATNITLTGPTVFLVKEAKAGRLKGAGLEIARRMLQFAERRMQNAARAPQPASSVLKLVSPTLLAEYSALMTRYLKVARAAGNLPQGVSDDEIIANTVQSAQQSTLFEVTPEVEEAYKKGRFPDRSNADVIADYAALFEKSKIDPPGPALYVLNEAKAGHLKGASLEVSVRIISQVGQNIQNAIEKQVQQENKAKPKQ